MDIILAGKLVYVIALIVAATIVLRKGGQEERIAIALCVLASGLTALMPPVLHEFGTKARWGYLTIDVALLLAFDAIMVRSRKFWPIWASGFQLAGVGLGVALMLDAELVNPYRVVQGKLAYPILLCLVLGSLPARRA